MICKDCIHYEVCSQFSKYDGANHEYYTYTNKSEKCECFKNKNEFVRLPCKVGDTVYYITGIHKSLIKPAKIKEIIFDSTGIRDLFVSTDNCEFENSFDIFYLTREEAEKGLEERSNGNGHNEKNV